MKKIIFLVLIMGSILTATAQNDPSAVGLSKFETIPAFNIYTAPDSTSFSNKNLKKNQPLIIMFFSPDCDHCQKETKELLAYKKELKDIQILMASPASYEAVKTFYKEYNLSEMHNVKAGQDVNYTLGRIYQLKTFPSIFVYGHNGKLAKAFIGNIGVPAILDAVK
jgi:thioredoxin-related protein